MKTNYRDIAESMLDTAKKHATGAVILAAGNSTRMGQGINKQTYLLDGKPVLAHTLLAYQKCILIREIVVVTRPQDFEEVLEIAKKYSITKLKRITAGGSTRQESSLKGVNKLSESIQYVAIADGARCLTTPEQIAKVCLKAYRHKAASAAHRISDTVKKATPTGAVIETVDRTNLWSVQTPQVFHTALYHAAASHAAREGLSVTDDNSMIEQLGYRVHLVECGYVNLKITTPDDLSVAEAILEHRRK